MIGPTLRLRSPQAEDAAQRLTLGNAPEIMRMFGADPAQIPPLTLEQSQAWVDRLAVHPHAWIVEHEGRFLGEVRLDEVDRQDRQCRLAIGFYDPGKLGKGLGKEAVRLALAHAFGTLELRRVTLRVVAYNERAIRCYRACGFVEAGRERDAVSIGGQLHDDVLMQIDADWFSGVRPGCQP
jgi:RimJ/RimL family protein N-acetyltransferase